MKPQIENSWLEATIILILAITIDVIYGEPPRMFHPVVITGKITEKISKKLIPISKNRSKGIFTGVILIISGLSIYTGIYRLTKHFVSDIFSIFPSEIIKILNIFADSFFLKTAFSLRALVEHAEAVRANLSQDKIDIARREVSKIVSRNTQNLEKPHIISAAVESVAENLVDSIIAPLFFFALFGLEGAITYRVINTLDAMVGYKTEDLKFIGFIPAKSDDILNFIPARLSIPFILIATFILRMNTKEAIKTFIKYRRKTESPNSYIPITLFSGALKIKLEKIGNYSIGDFQLPESEEKITEATRLAITTSLVFVISIIPFV